MRTVVLAVALLLAPAVALVAHEIPANVVVRAFVKPEGKLLRVLVRVPLDAMRDVPFPLRDVNHAHLTTSMSSSTAAPYLDLARADSTLRDAAKLWVADALVMYEDGTRLGAPAIASVRAALPSDRSFSAYASALAQVTGTPLPVATDLPWQQAMLDVLLEYSIARDDAAFSMDASFARLGVKTTTVLHVLDASGTERLLTYDGDAGNLSLDPSWWQAASQFVVMGFTHILDGIDHLLFLLCLVIPFRRARPVIALVTAFTIAHSITLVASAAGYAPDALWFPPFIEVLIALSIVYMACENIVGAKIERRWPVAFAFGLVHGFGFSFALRDTMQFAGSHLALSLAAFNIGVELGQLAVLAVAIPALHWLFARVMPERIGTILLSAMVGHTAWHWMTERFTTLREYRFTWPTMDALFLADVMRATAIALTVAAAAWLVSGRVRRWLAPVSNSSATVLAISTLAMGLLLSPVRVQAQKVTRSTSAGVYTAEQAAGGKEVFVAQCTGCHTSASHTGPAFAQKWMGRPLSELFGYVAERMPKATPGSLSEDEYVLVIAYVLKINGMPAGKTELSGDPALLNTIQFDTVAVNAGRSSSNRSSSSKTDSHSSNSSGNPQWFQKSRVTSTRNATEQR